MANSIYMFILQFNRGKIPERVVHARGMSAKGYFEVGPGLEASAILALVFLLSILRLFLNSTTQ